MKKILIIMIGIIFIVGCSHKEEPKKVKKEKKEVEIVEEQYKDENTMPIAFYKDEDILRKVGNFSITFKKGTDICLLQIYPSTEDKITYQGKFGELFHKTWTSYDTEKNHKMGFHITYTLNDGTEVSHYVYDPSNTMNYKPYVKVYLYDDYIHRNDSWYSHIEKGEYNDNTYLTSIKLTPGTDIVKVSSNIELTVFTYDTDDDFDENNDYIGNSKYTITITNKGNN